jgi:hypothetical protein
MKRRGKDSPDDQEWNQQSYVRGKNTPDDHDHSTKPQEPRKEENAADTTSRLLAAKKRAKDKRD